MSNSRAEYMRAYRRRQRSEQIKDTTMPSEVVAELLVAEDRIRELEGNNRRLQETIVFLDEEIIRLKRELAAGATPTDVSQPVVYQPTILPPARPDNRPIGTFGAPRPAPKPAPRKR